MVHFLARRNYTPRFPQQNMDNILEIIEESNETLSYGGLQKKVGMFNETFRMAINKLRDVGILERNNSKRKKVPICFTQEFTNVFPFIKIPDTYVLAKELYYNLELENGKTRKEIYSIRFQRILQYFLLRATFDTTYVRKVVSPQELNKPGQCLIYQDKKGHSYSNEDIQFTSTRELRKNPLVFVTLDFVSVIGVSVMDLVYRRDVGSDRLFSSVKTSVKECEDIINRLIQKGVLAPIIRDKVYESISIFRDPKIHDLLLEETRYKIGSEVLGDYVNDWNGLIELVLRIIEVKCMRDSEMSKVEREFYKYCYDLKTLNNYLRYQKIKHEMASKADGNNGLAEVHTADGMQTRYHLNKVQMTNSCGREIKNLTEMILSKLNKIKNKKEYVEIRNKYPFLHKMVINTVTPVSKSIGLPKKYLR